MIFFSGGGRSIKIWKTNKLNKSIELLEDNLKLPLQTPDPASIQCLVTDALSSLTSCRIEVRVVDKHESVNYVHDSTQKKYCTLLVGDTSGSTLLVVYDGMIEQVTENQSYIFTQVKTKKIRNHTILTTTAMSSCKVSEEVIFHSQKYDE